MAQPRPTVQLAEPAAGTDFRCLACALSFGTLDELKVHYKQEFHRANLQRKVSGLGPISADEFERRAAQQDPDADEAQLDSQPAGKDKHSRKRAKEAKLKAKNDERARRHEAKMLKIQQRAQAAGQPEAVPMTEEQEEEAVLQERTEAAPKLDLNQCIFSEKRFDDFEGALSHMARQYGFFIPDVEYLADPEGLVQYLRGKATIGYTCWYCEKAFGSWEAVRKHMIDKSHCKLPYDGTHPEVDDFYVFGDGTDDMDEGEGDEDEQTGAKAEAMDEEDAADGEEEEEEEDGDGAWEEVHDSEEVAAIEQEQGQQLALQYETAATRRADGRAALAASEPVVGDTVPELVLEDGRKLGHRSLARYYKQSVRPQTLASHQLIDNLIASYRSMGYEIVTRDMGRPSLVLTRAERKEQKQIFTRKAHKYMNLGIKQNKFHYNGVDDSGKARKV